MSDVGKLRVTQKLCKSELKKKKKKRGIESWRALRVLEEAECPCPVS